MNFDPLFPTLNHVVDAYTDEVCQPGTPLQNIMRDVCRRHGVTVEEFLGAGKCDPIVAIRLEAILAAVETGASQSAIARAYNRDHTTIRHALNKVRMK